MIFSILRRISSLGPCGLSMARPPLPFRELSKRIADLARHFRLFQPPCASGSDFLPVEQTQHHQHPRDEIAGEHTGDWRVILTKRSSTLSIHSGEVSLPGGKSEPGDKDDWETATREAKEEIELDPSLVKAVTCLKPYVSKHAMRIVPVIGILTNKKLYKPTPNPGEVEEIFYAPLEMFIKDENQRFEEREWMQEKYVVHYFDYKVHNNKYLIWGLTAGILIKAASIPEATCFS